MPTPFEIAERTATLMSLVLILGAAVFRVRVAGAMRVAAGHGGGGDLPLRLESFAVSAAAAAAATLVALAGVRLHAQVGALYDGWSGVGSAELRALILDTMWGKAWMLQVVAAAGIALGPLVFRPLDAWLAMPLAVSASMNGHAAAVEGIAPLTIGLDALHLLAAGGWAGGIFFVAVAARFAQGPPELLMAVRGFSTVALTCAGLLAMTGVLAAFVHLTKVGDLVTSAWGAQLVVKLALVGGMAAGGAWNWRRATPRLEAGDPAALRKGVAFELFFALAVLLATARLVLLSPPSA